MYRAQNSTEECRHIATTTLLVLAASRYQIPTILTAQQMGYRVVTTDNMPSNPGHALADASYTVDTTNREAVLELARREKVDGIISPCTDVAVPTTAFVAEQLGLYGVPFASACIVSDKLAFSRFLLEHDFPRPADLPITADDEPSADFFQNPWIIKPDRSSGSKGVFVVRSLDEFRQRLPETLYFSPTRHAILQEFIRGFQGTCEGIVCQGDLALAIIMDRQTVGLPYVATCGHHVPSRLGARLQEKLFAMLKRIWRILGITDAPFDCDFVATEDEVYLLEVTPRIGGNSITDLLKRAAGVDFVEYSVKQAVGDPVQLPRRITLSPMAVVLLGVSEKGRLEYDRGQAESLRREDWVDSFVWDIEYGQPVLPFINGRRRVGEAFICGKDRRDVDARVREFKRRLSLRAA